jgi:hypothetical protein
MITQPNTNAMKNSFICLLLLSLSMSSCHIFHHDTVKGNGNIISENREVGAFKEVEVSSAIHVILTPDSSMAVKVETDSNLQPYIEVYTKGSVLYIHQRNNSSINATKETQVYVSAPVFEKLRASGACKLVSGETIRVGGRFDLAVEGASQATLTVNAEEIAVTMNGASVAAIKGEAKALTVDANGSCELNAFGLSAGNVELDLEGASSAEVFPTTRLIAEANGASTVLYKGNVTPAYTLNGASKITRVD